MKPPFGFIFLSKFLLCRRVFHLFALQTEVSLLAKILAGFYFFLVSWLLFQRLFEVSTSSWHVEF
jgi:hypothetical protein